MPADKVTLFEEVAWTKINVKDLKGVEFLNPCSKCLFLSDILKCLHTFKKLENWKVLFHSFVAVKRFRLDVFYFGSNNIIIIIIMRNERKTHGVIFLPFLLRLTVKCHEWLWER